MSTGREQHEGRYPKLSKSDLAAGTLSSSLPPSYQEAENPAASEPSAPSFENTSLGFSRLTYDQVIHWWNEILQPEDRKRMRTAGGLLTPANLEDLRARYKQYYPKSYFPKKVYQPGELSVSDCCILFHFRDELKREGTIQQAFYDAFELAPPPYQAPSEQGQPEPTLPTATAWWSSLTEAQQQAILNRQFQPQQIIIIRREYSTYYQTYYQQRSIDAAPLDLYDYYLMSRYRERLRLYLWYSAVADILLDPFAVQLAARSFVFMGQLTVALVKASASFFITIGKKFIEALGGSASGKDGSKAVAAFWAGVLAVTVAITAAVSAFLGAVYAGIKSAKSVANILEGKKLGRSLWRLGWIGGGAYVGATQGLIIGAMIGSMVPVIGTVAGAIIGAVFGASITAAVAGFIAKHLARWYFKMTQGSTNPEKWDVAATEKALSKDDSLSPEQVPAYVPQRHQAMSTPEIQLMFDQLKTQKNQFKTARGMVPGLHNNVEKERYNKFLAAVKSGIDPREGIRVDAHTCFIWKSQEGRLDRLALDLPALAPAEAATATIPSLKV